MTAERQRRLVSSRDEHPQRIPNPEWSVLGNVHMIKDEWTLEVIFTCMHIRVHTRGAQSFNSTH